MTEPALPAKRTRKPAATATTPTDGPVATPAAGVAKPTTRAAKPKAASKPKAAASAAKPKAAAKPKTAAKPKAAAAAAKPATTARAKPKTAAKPRTAAKPKTATNAAAAAAVPAPSVDGMPHRDTPAPRDERPPLELARRIVELAEDKKAADIVLLDLTPLTTLADYFVICSGGSERQLDAIGDGIVSALRDEKTRPFGREGTPASHWVLLDFGSVVVHIFTPPERDYYGLEKHWSAARTVLRVQ